ncbi:MFS transporter [Zeaxanthinibacter sp. PT1]|uniref:MFS transporter n=1 Tax=Zeaxanthinibacter TaxID=561554 RepID=UPI0023490A88|nr:MFS transporter [Zeaxanthinibacter sp. PT1]MDC6351410.1 MFS transporter [Zeaxanthinibacter sp. PT1]
MKPDISRNKALFALAMGGFGIGLTEFVIMGILPNVAQDLDISIAKAGHFIAAYALGVVVGAPLLTAVAGKWEAHKVMLYLMLWFTVFNTLSAFAPNYELLMLSRFLSGLPHGAFFGIGAVVAAKLARKGKAAQAIATMFAGLTVANVLGVPLGTYLGQQIHWSWSFLLAGIVGLLTLFSVYFWIPAQEKASTQGFGKDIGILAKPQVLGLILLTTIGTGGFFAWYSYIAPLLTKVSGWEEEMVSYAMILAGLGMVAGNFLGAKLAEWFAPMKAVVTSLVLMTLVLVLNSFIAVDPYAAIIMTFVISMVAFTVGTPVQMAIIQQSKGSEMLGSSLNQSAFNMANASGAFFGGLPIAMGYDFTKPGLVGAGLAGVGVLIATVLLLMQRRQVKHRRRKLALQS